MLGQPSSLRFDEVGLGLLANQRRDGAFHNGTPVQPVPAIQHAQSNGYWFGNARGMLGLIWAHRYQAATNDRYDDTPYLDAAIRLGDHFVKHYFESDQPGKPSSFWWVATEALVELYRSTNNQSYLDAAVRVAKSVPPVSRISQHTHSYLLSLRGIVNICEELEAEKQQSLRDELLKKTLEQYAWFRNQVMWPGGGIVEHIGERNGYSINHWFDEGCSVFDWLGLNLDLWRLTGDVAYLDMAERVALNHLLFDQDESGGFCGDRGVDFVREGTPWPFCCAMHGTRTLSELPQYAITSNGKAAFVGLFYPSQTRLTINNVPVDINISTRYPDDGKIKLTISPQRAAKFPLHIRVPAWSRVLSLKFNDTISNPVVNNGWCRIQRRWQRDDIIELTLELPIRTEVRSSFIGDADDVDLKRVSLWHGPRQLVFNQSLNNHLWKHVDARPALRFAYQTYGDLQFDKSFDQSTLRIGEQEYKKGLGTHSVSEIVYSLNSKFDEFRCDIGIDSSTNGAGAVRFKVCVDRLVAHGDVVKASIGKSDNGQVQSLYGFEVNAMTGRDPARSIRVKVKDALSMRLVVDEAVNGLAKDHAVWANARLIRADGSVVFLSDLPDDRKLGLPIDRVAIFTNSIRSRKTDYNVSLAAKLADVDLQCHFSYLADLGYSLIKRRPVLHSWMRVAQ